MRDAHAGEAHCSVVETVTRAIDRACGFFESRTESMLKAHGIGTTAQTEWVDVKDFVAVNEEILDTTGAHTVRRIGKELADTYDWSTQPTTVGDALATLDDTYHRLHRGAVGGYNFERTGAESGRLVCKTPYPVELEEGLLRGIGQRFSETGFTKTDVVDTHREDGLLVTTIEVDWWHSEALTPRASTDAHVEPAEYAGAD